MLRWYVCVCVCVCELLCALCAKSQLFSFCRCNKKKMSKKKTKGYLDYDKDEPCDEILLSVGRFPKQCRMHMEAWEMKDIIDFYYQRQNNNNNNNNNKNENENIKIKIKIKIKSVEKHEITDEMIEKAVPYWCQQMFILKEERLARWYEKGEWFADDYGVDKAVSFSGISFLCQCLLIVVQGVSQ